MQNSYEDKFDFRENKPVGETHLQMNCFTENSLIDIRQKASLKWPTSIHNRASQTSVLKCAQVSLACGVCKWAQNFITRCFQFEPLKFLCNV